MADTTTSFSTRTHLLDAALELIRQKGYADTSIDDLCRHAGVTKGSFFHHFASKEELGIAAAQHFADMADRLFGNAPYRQLPDPVDRLLGYVDLRIQILQGPVHHYTCLLGTLVQELHQTHPAIRAACDRHMSAHIAELARDAATAREKYAPDAPWTPQSLALHMQAVIQGALIFAKARQDPQAAVEPLQHLRRYLELLFDRQTSNDKEI